MKKYRIVDLALVGQTHINAMFVVGNSILLDAQLWKSKNWGTVKLAKKFAPPNIEQHRITMAELGKMGRRERRGRR